MGLSMSLLPKPSYSRLEKEWSIYMKRILFMVISILDTFVSNTIKRMKLFKYLLKVSSFSELLNQIRMSWFKDSWNWILVLTKPLLEGLSKSNLVSLSTKTKSSTRLLDSRRLKNLNLQSLSRPMHNLKWLLEHRSMWLPKREKVNLMMHLLIFTALVF